jgi:hypothetical protein
MYDGSRPAAGCQVAIRETPEDFFAVDARPRSGGLRDVPAPIIRSTTICH